MSAINDRPHHGHGLGMHGMRAYPRSETTLYGTHDEDSTMRHSTAPPRMSNHHGTPAAPMPLQRLEKILVFTLRKIKTKHRRPVNISLGLKTESQTQKAFDVVVSRDGSPDHTFEVIINVNYHFIVNGDLVSYQELMDSLTPHMSKSTSYIKLTQL